jgi:hypothetical protein
MRKTLSQKLFSVDETQQKNVGTSSREGFLPHFWEIIKTLAGFSGSDLKRQIVIRFDKSGVANLIL